MARHVALIIFSPAMRGAHSEARVWTRGDLGREMLPHQPKPFLYKRVKIFFI